jgi:transcriptional regulator with XRE-family HTH domain
MVNSEKTYGYFYKMLSHIIAQRGHGVQVSLAIDVGVSDAHISQIISGKGRASFNLQVAIAKSLGFDYVDFMEEGRKLVEGERKESNLVCFETPGRWEVRPIIRNIMKMLDVLEDSDLRDIKKMCAEKLKLRNYEKEIEESKKRKRADDKDFDNILKRRYPF